MVVNAYSFTALFAGQPTLPQFETDGAWHRYYRGFRPERTFRMADAKHAAPAFVRDVLIQMTALVEDAPQRSATGEGA